MTPTPYNILIGIALLFSVVSMIWPKYPLLSVSVLLICIALFLPKTQG